MIDPFEDASGEMLSGWEKRQPKREDAGDPESGAKSAAQRKREQREREKAEQEKIGCHDESRNVTLDKDKDTEPRQTPPSSGVFCARYTVAPCLVNIC